MEKMRAVPDKRRTCTLATIIMGNLAGEKGMTLPTTPILRKEDLPDRSNWIESIRPNFMRKVFPIVFKTRRWLGTTDPIVTKTLAEKSMRGLWTSRWDGKGWDVLGLGFVCDLVGFLFNLLGRVSSTDSHSFNPRRIFTSHRASKCSGVFHGPHCLWLWKSNAIPRIASFST